MGLWSLRSRAGALAVVAPFLLLTGGAAHAACYGPQQQLPASTVAQFTATPAQLLAQYPNGGAQMISTIRDLVASDPTTLPLVLGLLPSASTDALKAIGTGLGQAALICVRRDQAFATEIQQALAVAAGGGVTTRMSAGGDSDQPKIGNAVTATDKVIGVTERGSQPITSGSAVYLNEVLRTDRSGKAQLLLADRTNVTAGPLTEIHLNKFTYDPSSGTGNLSLVGSSGSFRFITGVQPHGSYEIKTPFATIKPHGTEFIVVITPTGVEIQLISGQLAVTTVSGQVVTLSAPNSVVTVDSQGNTQGPAAANQPLVSFTDLGPPVTNLTFADVLAAFSAVTGNTATAATGAGGGGDGGGAGSTGASVTGFGGGGSSTSTTPNTFVVTTPTNFFALSFTSGGSSPGTTTTTVSVSPSR